MHANWFFGIGIDEYIEFPNLVNAVKDVRDFVDLLTDEYGVSNEHVITLFDEQANEENICDVLDRLITDVGENDSLLLYFSGHGHLDRNSQMGFWIPHDAKRGKTSRYIRNSTIRDYLKAIRSKHTLLISDSCFSGSLFVRGANRSSAALSELESIPSRWAICSGRHDEEVFDGPPGTNSPFAESILDALKSNMQELFNVARLADRVIEQTRSNYDQLPEGNPLHGVGHKGGQYVFHRIAREEKLWAEAQRNDRIAGYSRYLRQFPSGENAATALTRIKELEEKAAWKKANKAASISAFYAYLGRYPEGKFADDARQEILKLEQRQTAETKIPSREKPARPDAVAETPPGKPVMPDEPSGSDPEPEPEPQLEPQPETETETEHAQKTDAGTQEDQSGRGGRPKWLIPALVPAVIVVLLLAFWWVTPDTPPAVMMTIHSTPQGAAIRIDDKPVGTTPAKVKMSIGQKSTIYVEKEGYLPYKHVITVSNDGPREFTARLMVEPPGRKGMTFGLLRHYPEGSIHASAVSTVGCKNRYGADCDAYAGDTNCSEELPVLCFSPSPGRPSPDASVHQWAPGRIDVVGPFRGDAFRSLEGVNRACSRLGASGWQAAQFHQHPDGWNWSAFGSVPANTRFWVHIKNQPANCWSN